MAVLDIFNKNDEGYNQFSNNPTALGVLGEVANSVAPQEQSEAQQTPQSALYQFNSQEQPQQPSGPASTLMQYTPKQESPKQESGSSFWDTVKSVADKVGSGLATASQNPGLMDSLRAFGASVGNDRQGYESAMNSYTQRLDQNQQMKAKQQQEQNAIKIKQQQEYVANLYKQYTPESVQTYMGTGDPSTLVENAATTKTRRDDERADRSLDLQTTTATHNMQNQDENTSLAHQKYLQELQKYEDERGDKEGGKQITLDTGEVVTTPGVYQTKDGTSVKVTSNGGKLSSEPLTGKEAPSTGEPASISQIKADTDIVRDALVNKPNTVNNITGPIVGRNDTLQDYWARGTDTRNLYQAAKRIDASYQNMGIAEAKAAGASGINTLAEVEQFTRGMPLYDFTSSDAFAESQKRKDEYMARWNAAHPNKGSNTTQSQPSSPVSLGGGWTVTKH